MTTCTLYAHRLGDPAPTGIPRYVAEMVRRLPALTGGPDDLAYALAASPEPGAVAPERWLTAQRPGLPRALLHGLWSAAHRPLVDRWIEPCDVLHVLYPSCPVPTRARLVVTVHDLMPLQHPDWFGRSEVWRFERALDHARRHAERFVAISAHTARELEAVAGIEPGRIDVIPLAVADEFRQPVPPATIAAGCARHGLAPGRYVVVLGAVSRRKNLTPVLEALAALPHPDLTLVSIGPDGSGAGAVRAEVDALGLRPRVRFLGWRPGEEARALVAGALALVHPSVAEGFGMPPLEAMALGVPALASRAGSLPEVCGPAAVLLDPHDAGAWAEAIAAVGADPDHRAALVAAGLAHSAPFTWAATAAATHAVHQRLWHAA